jgi:hypothetical protein
VSSPSVRNDIERWTRTFNRRRLAERAVRCGVLLGLGALLVVGVQRLVLASMVMGTPPAWMPPPAVLQMWAWISYAAVAAAAILYTGWRAWQGRIDGMTLARRLDREHATHDVLSTALALETGVIEAPHDLAAIVQARATTCSASLHAPVPPFAAPSRALATMGAVAAAVALLPASAESLVDLAVRTASAAPAEHQSELADPALSPESLERLERSAAALAELERRQALHESARARLQEARAHLEAAGQDPGRSLARLSRAEQSLRELQRQSREEGLLDPEQLRAMSRDELAEGLTDAIERREDDTAAALADEMARRVEDADDRTLSSMASALDQALGQKPQAERGSSDTRDPSTAGSKQSGGEGSSDGADENRSGASDDPHARWQEATEGLPEQMRAGEGDAARDTLRKMAEEMAGSGGRPGTSGETADRVVERALDDVRRARSEQLAEMNREGAGASEPKPTPPDGSSGQSQAEGGGNMLGEPGDEAEGKPGGAGIPFGMPGGKPGPGGGSGSDELGDPREAPLMSLHGAEKVEAGSDGSTQGSVSVIQRFTEGHRDDREYEDLHHQYESVAESAVRREQIPLTRRDYIRNYFQAVRPR